MPFDAVIIDEAQDFNPAQMALAMKIAGDNGRMFVIGDTNQSIMGFAGADTESMENFAAMLAKTSRGVKTMPLTLTRRCPRTHVQFVKDLGLLENYEAHEDNLEGSIEQFSYDDAIRDITPGSMVICRNNAPLIPIMWSLVKAGIKVHIAGKEIGTGLIALIKRLKAGNVGELVQNAEKWREKETSKYVNAKNAESKVAGINDQADCLLAFVAECDTIDEVVSKISQVFADFDETGAPKAAVLLCSYHKSKGLEAHNIYIYKSELCPSKWAVQAWQQKQERNLLVVAYTRSKDRMIFMEGKPEA